MPIKYNLPIPSEIQKIAQSVSRGVSASLFGMSLGEKVYLASSIKQPVLFVTADYYSASNVFSKISSICNAALLPALPDVLTYKQGSSDEIFYNRIHAINKLISGSLDVLVISVQSLCELFPTPSDILKHTLNISKNQNISFDNIIKILIGGGYKRTSPASTPGTFSLRGDILDIYPIDRTPVRIEFFGDTVESIRTYSLNTELKPQNLSDVIIYPATEFFIDEQTYSSLLEQIPKKRIKNLEPDSSARQNRIVEELMFKLEARAVDNSLQYISYMLNRCSLNELLPKDTIIIYDETKLLFDGLNNLYNEHYTRIQSLLMQGEVFEDCDKQLAEKDKVFLLYEEFNKLAFHKITTANKIFNPDEVFSYHIKPITRYAGNFEELVQDIKIWLENGYHILLSAKDRDQANVLQSTIRDKGLYLPIVQNISDDFLQNGKALITIANTAIGCSWHEDKYILIGNEDLFTKKSTIMPSKAKDVFFEVKQGDYVVHFIHGIGICKGITRMSGTLGTKDYIVLEYRDGDRLYVSTEQSDMLSKYSGSTPKLSKLGGVEFAKVKQKVKDDLKQMAFDLQNLYAERSRQKGYVYEIDDEMLKAFEAAFPYTETPDQRRATDEILMDMQKGIVMERLLCGDVGYGKTEVALRAAFATAICNRQVAFLAPTTILSEQHYKTAFERLDEWGIKVEVINRFKSTQEIKNVLQKLKDGEINVLCGTHRLLSKDVIFKNLGLLILDEEQRFGVEDKEKIKLLKNNINVLSMSATPIPRTLHMSLSGIRDISLISVPPADRLPVQTYVTELTDGLMKDAIIRELSRGGQVFVVYNRSEFIDAFAAKIKLLVPDAKVEVIFGTMPEEKLSRAVKRFYDGQTNVLICTTIIENGIDLPLANTLIVCNADRFGLSQLYQLRGRVGRSNRLGYAYLTFSPEKELTTLAYKRLEALMEFTELGSGFKIALKDLEIRGAGTVLGRKQHGHMEKVGYELYAKLLNQARAELDNGQAQEISECRIDADFDAYIPDELTTDSDVRMRLYNRISAIQSNVDRMDVINEIKQVFGLIPKEVENLVNIGLYKGMGIQAKARIIRMQKAKGEITFDEVTPELIDTVNEYKDFCMLDIAKKPVVKIKTDVYKNIYKFLDTLKDKYKAK